MYLRAFVGDTPSKWCTLLPWAEYWYNTTVHGSSGCTPFQAVYGRAPPPIIGYSTDATAIDTLAASLTDRDNALTVLKLNLRKAQQRMQAQANKSRRDKEFQVADWVYVKLQPYRQHSLAHRTHPKFARRFFGPYEIVARIGKVAYKLALPTSSKIHPVFHISVLKFCPNPNSAEVAHMPDHAIPYPEPYRLLDSRVIRRNHTSHPQVLVHWKESTPIEATWEEWIPFHNTFPHLRLEDKAFVGGGYNDTETAAAATAEGAAAATAEGAATATANAAAASAAVSAPASEAEDPARRAASAPVVEPGFAAPAAPDIMARSHARGAGCARPSVIEETTRRAEATEDRGTRSRRLPRRLMDYVLK